MYYLKLSGPWNPTDIRKQSKITPKCQSILTFRLIFSETPNKIKIDFIKLMKLLCKSYVFFSRVFRTSDLEQDRSHSGRFSAATAAQEAHLSVHSHVRTYVTKLCFCNFWQLLASVCNCWQLWQILATFGNIWQLLVTFGNFW